MYLLQCFATINYVCILHIKYCRMKQIILTITTLFLIVTASAQLLFWSPQFPNDNSTITITLDANKGNQGLLGYTGTVYMHLGLITNLSTTPGDWKYVPTTWASTTAPTATSLGGNKWSFTITNPRAYFNAAAGGVPAGETILKVAILFRDAAGTLVQKNTDGSDMFIPIYAAAGNYIQFTNPLIIPANIISNEAITATINQSFAATAVASTNAGTLNMYFNGAKIAGPLTGTSTITANPTVTATGNQQIISELIVAGVSYYDTVKFYVSPTVVTAPLPSGAVEGINYNANCSSVTLVLFAPNKSNAMVLGDFLGSNWASQSAFQMNRTPDGNYYWLTINGLTSGTEYAYQYLVDNSIYIADPYSEKILDPNNDQFIPTATYPNLKPYPVNANVSAGQNGIVSVLQPCAPAYNWKVTNFTKPDKRNLITYELLVRDFGDARNYQMLIDTIGYFKRLGINAIEFMPVSEFTGNDSWGYNPTFYCALDKAYGTKNKFKELIDLCHQNGIAVILDVVYNQMDAVNNPEGKLYWDAANNRPAANSPWFNQSAPHPYSVFDDLNHTSTATQYLVKRSMDYWLSEYKVDGFRFDLAKGFTQTQSNGTTVENYDASRVANINRYYDYVISKYPTTYMILEFLGQQRQEEQEYANKGFMLWSNNNPAYNQNTMGFASNSDFSKIIYNNSQAGYTTPAVMGYMESHDEERLMYKNLQYGNSAGSYNVKNLATALDRQTAAAALFFTIPGPKMIWQFGERGYDIPIDFISRVSAKPPHWEYMADVNRLKLWNTYATLINLRLSNPSVFNNPVFTYDFNDNNGLFKRFQIADTASAGIKITVIANMDVTAQTRTVIFQTAGNWKSYISNGTGTGINGLTATAFNIAAASQSITLQPGEYHVYMSMPPCATALPTVVNTVNYCQNATATALSATGTNLLWYTVATGGTSSSTAPTPVTSAAGTTMYYVSQTANGCEGLRASISVNVTALPMPPAVVKSSISYCQNEVAASLAATGTNLLWYSNATGGASSSTAPIPSTAVSGTTNFYVSQSTACGESARALITVNVNPIPGAVTGLTTISSTLTSVTLGWNLSAGIFYTIDFKLATSSTWTNAASNTNINSITITNLLAATTYDWRISANCAATPTTNFTTAQFTTSSRNNTITNLKNGFGIKISPTPAISDAIIDYLVPGNGVVNISLINSVGQRVQILFSGVQNQGQYQLNILNKLGSLGAGNYFIMLNQNGEGYYIQFIKK